MLTVQTNTPAVNCTSDGSGANVSLLYSVVSTGSADSADVVLIVNGAESSLGTIASGNVNGGGGWTFSGRTRPLRVGPLAFTEMVRIHSRSVPCRAVHRVGSLSVHARHR